MTNLSSPPSFSFDETPPSMDDDPSFDVGIAVRIARKKKLDQQLQKQKDASATHPPVHSTSRVHSSLQDFLYGISLYVLCLSLPTLLGALTARMYREKETLHVQTYYEQMSDYLCQNYWTFFCCPTHDSSLSSLKASDAEWTDVGLVAILSMSLATLRLALVHLLVPRYLAPKRLEALVRCKSVHLLSSSYPESVTPQSKPRTLVQLELPPAPILFPLDHSVAPQPTPLQLSGRELHVPPAPILSSVENSIKKESVWTSRLGDVWHELKSIWSTVGRSVWSTVGRSARRVLGFEPKAPYDGDELQDVDRLFAAPRYATAVFRLLYCIGSCTCAMVWLRNANFFPPSVGGRGSTADCWDLKGGVALEADSDFDHHNAVLRKYFLVQASYHLHSWATHWMSLLALWWYGKSSLVSIKKSMLSYGRALAQHLLALAMIGGCFLFSSLRRLGAIGIFALDASSLFIHLLQLCINAPPNSWLNKPRVIAWIHRGLVIPMFLYCRFYVFPFVVWHSAIFESRDWLRQMERTLFPGSAKAMKMVFNGFLLMNLMLNLVLFRRLLFHPHLQQSVCERTSPKDSSDFR